MNTLKKTLALVATLAMASTAFVGCGKEEEKKEDTKPTEAATEAPVADATEAPVADATEAPAAEGALDPSVGTGGDKLTVAAWNPDDVPFLIAQWKGLDYKTVADQLTNGEVEGINFINMGVPGGEAAENQQLHRRDR